MTIIGDSEKRVRLETAKPGDVFDVQANKDGSFLLKPMYVPKDEPAEARLEKRGKYTVVVTNRPIDEQQLLKEIKGMV